MTEEIRGFSEPADVMSVEEASEFLGVEAASSDSEIDSAYRELVPKAHPDSGGTEDLFVALKRARKILKGEIAPTEGPGISVDDVPPEQRDTGPSQGGGQRGRRDRGPDPGDFSTDRGPGDGGFGGKADDPGGSGFGFGQGPPQELVDEVIDILTENFTQEQLQEKFGEIATYTNVAELLATLIINGSITLGDVEKIIGGDFAGSAEEATGGNFSKNPGGGFTRGGDDSNFSSDPDDFAF